jgi:hypothetical protein
MDPVLFSAPHLDLARSQKAERRHSMPGESHYQLILLSTSFRSIGWTTAHAESNDLASTVNDHLVRQGVLESRFRLSDWLIGGR